MLCVLRKRRIHHAFALLQLCDYAWVDDAREALHRDAVMDDIAHPHFERTQIEELAALVDECLFVERAVDDHGRIFGPTVFFGVAANADELVGIVEERTVWIMLVMVVETRFGDASGCLHGNLQMN